jgi:hypothetical protein
MVSIRKGKSKGPEDTAEQDQTKEAGADAGTGTDHPLDEWEQDFVRDMDERRKAFFLQLRKAFEEDLNRDVLDKTEIFEHLFQNFKAFDGQPMVFRSETTGNKYNVTRDAITYEDADGTFTFADAYEMAKLASLDKDMQRKGVTLQGSRWQKQLLQQAIKEVNKELEAAGIDPIKINNKLFLPSVMVNAIAQADNYFKDHANGFSPTNKSREEPKADNDDKKKKEGPKKKKAGAEKHQITDEQYKKIKDIITAKGSASVNQDGFIRKETLETLIQDHTQAANKGKAYKELTDRLKKDGVLELVPGKGYKVNQTQDRTHKRERTQKDRSGSRARSEFYKKAGKTAGSAWERAKKTAGSAWERAEKAWGSASAAGAEHAQSGPDKDKEKAKTADGADTGPKDDKKEQAKGHQEGSKAGAKDGSQKEAPKQEDTSRKTNSAEDEKLREAFKKAVEPETAANGSKLTFAFSNETIVRMRQAFRELHSSPANSMIDTALKKQFEKAVKNRNDDGLIRKLTDKLNFVYGEGTYNPDEMIRNFDTRQRSRTRGPESGVG